LVGVSQQFLQLAIAQYIKSFQRRPFVPGHVRRWIDSILFDQLVEFLFGALEGQHVFRRWFQHHHREHLSCDLENQVVAPLNILRRVREGETVCANGFRVHEV
jgi:hypothetical protein